MKKPKKIFLLSVSYKGYNTDLDRLIEKTVGKEAGGTGFCFANELRDLSFDFDSKEKAEKISNLLKKKLGKQIDRTEIYETEQK